MPQIGTKHISSTELDNLIQSIFISSDAITILERWFCDDGESPDYFDYISKLSGNFSDWDKGRVFDDNNEMRWERDGDEFHVVWMSDNGMIDDEWAKEEISFIRERKILLWGERISGKAQWYEKQIPRIFEYPVKGDGKRVYAILKEYNLLDGSTVYRLRGVKAK